MRTITTKDGTQIYYKDWGAGQSVVFSHGWPLCADSWEAQMMFLASNGYRCIAHDRRGHGRSSQPWNGNEMDAYADDQIVPIGASALASAKLVRNATLKIYAGAPHGLAYTHKDPLNADLLAFLKP
ncbi:alpha/beta hydrolase [Desulfococcus multivorans]|jgi:non-heme chloroperoxidase|uniref:AB hydrolase-1 domain-containing protein n=2 Tax=Desulfococcus multivorans TaxID=897 RepID=S7TB10_DESML|nr:putative non-heme chloroperoxidase [Desulfococcus multivorans]AQU99489.1 alpha/beta hydrolase [Desulfococcus multivorans]EPR34307.1 hypothetical protein dsmv_3326 [Desulfococcus multivorans DSM 2059]SJZ90509.1 alpha/beta hydrolase fold [Desulfococcus multivorans DSM 2059]